MHVRKFLHKLLANVTHKKRIISPDSQLKTQSRNYDFLTPHTLVNIQD